MASDRRCLVPKLLLPSLLLIFLLIPRCAAARPSPLSHVIARVHDDPLRIINIILVLFEVLVCLGFIYIIYLACARPRAESQGLSRKVLRTFPMLLYSEVKELLIGKDALECSVCLDEFKDQDMLRLLPGCSHAFHRDCIDTWLASHETCPVCRANLAKAKPPAAASDPAPTSNNGSDTEATGSPVAASGDEHRTPPDKVVIVVDRTEEEEEEEERQLELQPVWRPPKFPRSHSTGHSVDCAATASSNFRHSGCL